jgi:stage II sporulation protein D
MRPGIPRFIRIGLALDLRSVQISAPGRLKIETLLTGSLSSSFSEGGVSIALRSAQSEQSFGHEPAPLKSAPSETIYRIQVASFRDKTRAEATKGALQSRFEVPVTIQLNESTETYRVRVGAFTSREDAEAFGEKLQDFGYVEVWIVTEEESHDDFSTPKMVNHASDRAAIEPTVVIENEQHLQIATVQLSLRHSAPISVLRIAPVDARDFLSFDKTSYRGSIELVESPRGRLTVVNVVDLEDYLKGVVPNEMPPSKFDAMEALKAQAVAARTYALRNSGRFLREGYELCATIACQTYRGVPSERPLSSEAVEATRGIVIKYHGALIDSLYTSTCGGRTEDSKNIFRSVDVPYLRSAECPPESAAEVDPRLVEVSGYHMKWNVRITREELEGTLRKTLPLDELVDLVPLRYGLSKRVIELRVVGRKHDFILRGLEVKSALGLKDTLFTLHRERDRRGGIVAFEFDGRGWGHGVGLCQTGAYGLARQGENFESILKTYYFDVDVVQETAREN